MNSSTSWNTDRVSDAFIGCIHYHISRKRVVGGIFRNKKPEHNPVFVWCPWTKNTAITIKFAIATVSLHWLKIHPYKITNCQKLLLDVQQCAQSVTPGPTALGQGCQGERVELKIRKKIAFGHVFWNARAILVLAFSTRNVYKLCLHLRMITEHSSRLV